MTMAHSIPPGAFSRTPASSSRTPSTWRTPYELYDERRSASSSSSSSNPASVADTINVRGIQIAGWRIESYKGSIADSKSIDERSDAWGIPLPEMPFDKNRLVLRYVGHSTETSSPPPPPLPTKWEYCLDGMTALRGVEGVSEELSVRGITFDASDGDVKIPRSTGVLGQKPTKASKRVQVSYASEWGKKREQQSSTAPSAMASHQSGSNFGTEVAMAAASGTIATARDYDWTYTSTWPGEETSAQGESRFKPVQDLGRDRIPVERLGPPSMPGAKAEPILFFDDVILFEDELGDNGTSMLSVKVRVMPTGFLVLQRFFLRVDNVVFRVFDTRIYVAFYEGLDDEHGATVKAPPTGELAELTLNSFSKTPALASPMRVVRECCGYQRTYTSVRARLPPYKPNDLSPLTEPGWVAQQLIMMAEQEQRRQTATHPGTTVPIRHADPTLPAVLPNRMAPGHESNRIIGEIQSTSDEAEDRWEGEGSRIDVAII